MQGEPTVLVVDDEPNIVRQLSFVLERAGLRVLAAADGEEALQTIRAERPRVVLLDVMMPRMNGYEVCAAIKSDPNIRGMYVALLSAKGQEADRGKGLLMGADEYIVKPFNPIEVAQRIRALVMGDGVD